MTRRKTFSRTLRPEAPEIVAECPYCTGHGEFKFGKEVFPDRLDYQVQNYWVCSTRPNGCQAIIGTKRDGHTPLGRLLDNSVGRMRQQVHVLFDPIWQKGVMRKADAMAWLAAELGLPSSQFKIEDFDAITCRRAIAIALRRRGLRTAM